MPVTSKYLFVVSMDIDPVKEDLFNEIYNNEHIPNLLEVPGVISATRLTMEPLTLKRDDWKLLLESRPGKCVSLFMPF